MLVNLQKRSLDGTTFGAILHQGLRVDKSKMEQVNLKHRLKSAVVVWSGVEWEEGN